MFKKDVYFFPVSQMIQSHNVDPAEFFCSHHVGVSFWYCLLKRGEKKAGKSSNVKQTYKITFLCEEDLYD